MVTYWKKKNITSFILAVLVSLIHLEVSRNYTIEDLSGGVNLFDFLSYSFMMAWEL